MLADNRRTRGREETRSLCIFTLSKLDAFQRFFLAMALLFVVTLEAGRDTRVFSLLHWILEYSRTLQIIRCFGSANMLYKPVHPINDVNGSRSFVRHRIRGKSLRREAL
jgi:hypothetical protein